MRRRGAGWRLFVLVQLVLLAVWQTPAGAAGSPAPSSSPPPATPAAHRAAGRTFGPLRSAPQAPPSGLISEWDAEGNANDTVGTNNGSFDGSYTASQPGLGQAFLLNGAGQSVTIPDSPSLHPSAISVAAWVRVDNLNTGGAGAENEYLLFKQNNGVFDFEGYTLIESLSGDGTHRFVFATSQPNDGQSVTTSSTPVVTGVWYHLAGTFDGSTTKLYVNGSLEASAPASGPLNVGTSPATSASPACPPLTATCRARWTMCNSTTEPSRMPKCSKSFSQAWPRRCRATCRPARSSRSR